MVTMFSFLPSIAKVNRLKSHFSAFGLNHSYCFTIPFHSSQASMEMVSFSTCGPGN